MTDSIPARHISLADFRRNPCSILGAAIDTNEVVLIGVDAEHKPLAVLVGWDLWKQLGGEDVEDDASPGDAATGAMEPQPDPKRCKHPGCRCLRFDGSEFCADHDDEPMPPKPEPVKGAEGLWPCREMGCPCVVEEPGTFCEEHEGIYLKGSGE